MPCLLIAIGRREGGQLREEVGGGRARNGTMASVGRCSGCCVVVRAVRAWLRGVPGRSKTRAVWTVEGGEPDGGKVEKSRDEGAERVEMRNAQVGWRKIEGSMDVCGLKAARQTKSAQFSSTLRVSPGFPRQQLGVMPGDVSLVQRASLQ